MKIIGVDIGGTKIHAALVQNQQIVKDYSCPTPFNKSKEEVIQAVESAIQQLFSDDVVGIGIGVPGLVDLETNEVIDVLNIPSWDRVPLKAILEKSFKVPVYVNNDANCFALGEKYYGKGQPFKNFVGITIGTGLGAGIIINNHLYSGKFCGAGEFGTIYYRDGMVENYASGQFFKAQELDGAELFTLAGKQNEAAIQKFYELGEHIGRAIANVLYSLAPDAIILGGSVANSYSFFEKGMHAVLKNEFEYQRLYQALKIEISELKNSGVLGASSLVLDALN